MNRLMEDFAAEASADRQLHADMVETIGKAEETIKTIEKNVQLSQLRDGLKQWLALNNEESLDSPDGGFVARLQDRSTTEWDLRPLQDDQILALARAGMLTVKTGAFDALRKAAPSTTWDDICAHNGVRTEGVSTALIVKKAER